MLNNLKSNKFKRPLKILKKTMSKFQNLKKYLNKKFKKLEMNSCQVKFLRISKK